MSPLSTADVAPSTPSPARLRGLHPASSLIRAASRSSPGITQDRSRLRSDVDPADLAITDRHLPEVNGHTDTARAAAEILASVDVVFPILHGPLRRGRHHPGAAGVGRLAPRRGRRAGQRRGNGQGVLQEARWPPRACRSGTMWCCGPRQSAPPEDVERLGFRCSSNRRAVAPPSASAVDPAAGLPVARSPRPAATTPKSSRLRSRVAKSSAACWNS